MPIDLTIPVCDFVAEQSPTYIETKSLPPSYSQLFLNKEEIIISQQPKATKDLPENSINLNDLQFINYRPNKNSKKMSISDKYMAFSDDNNYGPLSLCIKPMINVTNKDKIISKLYSISCLPLKGLRLSQNKPKLIAFFKDANNEELYLIENNNLQQNLTETADFNKITKLPCPLQKLAAISFDINNNIYIAGIKGNALEVYSLSTEDINISTENNFNWNLDLKSTIDGINNVNFSKDGLCLYVLSKQNIFNEVLSVYLKRNNFELIAEVPNTARFPVDIDSAHETLVFIDDKKLTLENLIDNNRVSTHFTNKLTFARFIPGTKDILFFNATKQIGLLKNNTEKKLSYYLADTIKSDITIIYADFDANDKNKLRVIATTSDCDCTHLLMNGTCLFATLGCMTTLSGTGLFFLNKTIVKATSIVAFSGITFASMSSSVLLGLGCYGFSSATIKLLKNRSGINDNKKWFF